MLLAKRVLPWASATLAVALSLSTDPARGFSLLGFSLPLEQRDFRIHNNFTGPHANDNATAHASFPGHVGAVMAIWKASVEWQSRLHGDGDGDPHQSGDLGSGGANFDPTFQAEATSPGDLNANTHSQISGCAGGVFAFCEGPSADGWRIRYYACVDWDDGPGTVIAGIDMQGVATHEYGHALGLGHSSVSGATMYPSLSGGGVEQRSIEADDSAGIQAVYGVHSHAKPVISDGSVAGNQVTLTGSGFDPIAARVWFTQARGGGTGEPVEVAAGPTGGGLIVVFAPTSAGPGDVLVRNPGPAHDALSNAWPVDLPRCPDPAPYCVTSPNSVGSGMLIGHAGSTGVGATDLALRAERGPPGQPGIFFYGPEKIAVPFGDGVRCVGAGALGTYRLPVETIDAGGSVHHALDWSAPPVGSGPGAITAGDTWMFQFWYRDPAAGGSGYNLSDALEILFCP
ncbi:MAG: matrixin family metalloprotease [Planctomycetota bacterium]|jgi:hypothetical protein|nr:matrixin family metalloprotease [Planctomycetota bacterium]MDP6762260.1 matrixin family metalloprotease [Planctomycetota bacterium]MDP6988129.1 matrixin family metalloprotease [Planctomycetota bacterium]